MIMAGRYICPVCDRRLRMKHFCTYCKSFVKEPVYYTGPVANESYDSGCMADQHYGLGHVHGPLDRQKEYGHHKAGTGAGRNPSARPNTYANRSQSAQQAGRSVQQPGRSAQRSVRSGQRTGFGTVVPSRGQAGGSNYGSVRPHPAQSARFGQSGGRQQAEGANRRVKKFFAVFWAAFAIIMLVQVVFAMIGFQGTGLPGDVFYFVPFTFLFQFLNVVFQVGFFALIIWVIARNIRRK